jgi:hypothetical protein
MKTTSISRKLPLFMAAMMLFVLSGSHINAQTKPERIGQPAFVGLGLGINDNGLAIGLELPVLPMFSIVGTAGLGAWGWKVGAGITYYPSHTPFKSGISVSYYSASGIDRVKQVLWVEPDGAETDVYLKLYRVGTVNLVYSYNLKVGKASKFVFSGGYAIPVSNDPAYEILYNSQGNIVLTDYSENFMEFMKPGGLIVGVKFMFGI